MTKRLGWLLSLLIIAVPACAASSGSISGVVKSADGKPQMGAIVEIMSARSLQSLLLYTDETGRYDARDIVPGVYNIKVSAASFLPSLRENINLRSGAHVIVNLTVSTLFEAIQMLPPRKTSPQDDDDWKWTLRSAASRPILRVLDHDPLVLVSKSESEEDRALKARVAFVAGSNSDGFGDATDYATAFALDESVFSSGTISLSGKVGYGNGEPAGVVRASYKHQFENGSAPQFALTMRRSTPAGNMQGNVFSSLEWTYSDTQTIADFLELKYGGQMQSVQFLGTVTGFRPFGSLGIHLTPNTVLEYRYATAEPLGSFERSIAGSDTVESAPRITVLDNSPGLEKASHQEVAVSQRVGKTNLQAALFTDRVKNVALTGAGTASVQDLDFLPNYSAGTFTYNGGRLHSNGVRVVMQHKLNDDLIAAFDYAFGNVLTTSGPTAGVTWAELRNTLHPVGTHAITAKFSGKVPVLGTRWGTSYKWSSENALTPVDMFNASAGQSDAFLSCFLRQPIPGGSLFSGKLEAMVDVRNLLAQGYRPFLGQDGHTLYLVQSPRAVRGGLSFTF
jgi:Carboxypeptidase regulatory-like domain